jgi:hypothetical protein
MENGSIYMIAAPLESIAASTAPAPKARLTMRGIFALRIKMLALFVLALCEPQSLWAAEPSQWLLGDVPDAIICHSQDTKGVSLTTIFYFSQQADDLGKTSHYSTPFIREPKSFDSTTFYKWHLTLSEGHIGNVTMPTGYKNVDCTSNWTVAQLKKEGRALKVFH